MPFLLCGLIVPRDSMTQVLQWVSDLLPLSYAVDGMQEVATSTGLRDVGVDAVILLAFSCGALLLGALTLRRRTD